jgi:hypothetical protein
MCLVLPGVAKLVKWARHVVVGVFFVQKVVYNTEVNNFAEDENWNH